jgi:hypothetical protein
LHVVLEIRHATGKVVAHEKMAVLRVLAGVDGDECAGESKRGSGCGGVFEECGWNLVPGGAKRADVAGTIRGRTAQDL